MKMGNSVSNQKLIIKMNYQWQYHRPLKSRHAGERVFIQDPALPLSMAPSAFCLITLCFCSLICKLGITRESTPGSQPSAQPLRFSDPGVWILCHSPTGRESGRVAQDQVRSV